MFIYLWMFNWWLPSEWGLMIYWLLVDFVLVFAEMVVCFGFILLF